MFKYWQVEFDNQATYFPQKEFPEKGDLATYLEENDFVFDSIDLVEEKTEVKSSQFIDAPKDCISFVCPYCGYHHILTNEEDSCDITLINQGLEYFGQVSYVCDSRTCHNYFTIKE